MDVKRSVFDVQKAVIPLWKALTKLYKSYFIKTILFISQNIAKLAKMKNALPFFSTFGKMEL